MFTRDTAICAYCLAADLSYTLPSNFRNQKDIYQKQINMKTAVEWLELEFEKYTRGGVQVPNDKIFKLTKKALEKEKEQIADAFRNGSTSSMLGGGHWTQYYNQTYNENK